MVDPKRLADTGKGKFAFAGGGSFRGVGFPSAWFACGAQFVRRMNHAGGFADVEHREIDVAVGKPMAVGEGGAGFGGEPFRKDRAHFDNFIFALVVASDDVGEQSDPGGCFQSGAEVEIETKSFGDGFDPDLGAGRAEYGDPALLFLLLQNFEHFRVEAVGVVLVDKFLGELIQFRWCHSPEVIEKNALHAFTAQDFMQGEEGEEDEQVKASPRHAFQDEIAEQQLGVPWDQGLIEVKERVAPVRRLHCHLLNCLMLNGFLHGREVDL